MHAIEARAVSLLDPTVDAELQAFEAIPATLAHLCLTDAERASLLAAVRTWGEAYRRLYRDRRKEGR